jgi:hypothetical protein
MGVLCAPLLLPEHRREKGLGDEGHHSDLARSGASSITRVGVSRAPLAQRARPQPSRPSTASRSRAPLGRCPRGPPRRRSPALRATAALARLHRALLHAPLAAASPAFFHHLTPTRPGRPLPARSSPTSLRRVPCGRSPRVLSPRRPHAPLPAATRALFHRAPLRVLVDRCPRVRRRRLPRRAAVAAVAQRIPSAASRRATGLRASDARGRACRNRLGRRGFGDRKGRACRSRMDRVAGRQGGPHGPWPREFQQARRRGGPR